MKHLTGFSSFIDVIFQLNSLISGIVNSISSNITNQSWGKLNSIVFCIKSLIKAIYEKNNVILHVVYLWSVLRGLRKNPLLNSNQISHHPVAVFQDRSSHVHESKVVSVQNSLTVLFLSLPPPSPSPSSSVLHPDATDVTLSESGEIEPLAEAQSGGLPTTEGTVATSLHSPLQALRLIDILESSLRHTDTVFHLRHVPGTSTRPAPTAEHQRG